MSEAFEALRPLATGGGEKGHASEIVSQILERLYNDMDLLAEVMANPANEKQAHHRLD
jgi:hypothetical protein